MNITSASLLLLVIVCVVLCVKIEAKSVHKRSVGDGVLLKKRPFCNTFTGCGRKRSESYQNLEMVNPVSSDDLTDIRRQLLSDARLWELLQSRLRDENLQLQDLLRKRRSISRNEPSI